MDFLTLDKIFVLDNFSFVQDKKYFVQADEQGISVRLIRDMDRAKFSSVCNWSIWWLAIKFFF